MNLDDLKVIRNDERRSRRLTPLKDTFYGDLKEYLGSLAGSKDPQKIDEYENALQVAEAIYDKRAAKIIKLAALTAKGHKEGAPLTDEETRLFKVIFEAFTRYKDEMLTPVTSDSEQAPASQGDEPSVHSRTGVPLSETPLIEGTRSHEQSHGASVIRGSAASEELSATDKDNKQLDNTRALIQENKNMKYVQVRVLADIPAFVGLDGENYNLSKGETTLLPEGNARPLIRRHVAITIGDKIEDA